WFLSTTRLHAGPYNLLSAAEAPQFSGASPWPLPFPVYRDLVSGLMSLNRPSSPGARHYEQQVAQLELRYRAGKLPSNEQASLGAYLIRLRRYDQALEVLTRAAQANPRDFMILANLAAAFQLQGRFERALSYLQQALDYWPADYPRLTKDQL